MNEATSRDAVYSKMVELRRRFHRFPELAFHELRTAATIIEELQRLEIPYSYEGEGSAVVGRLGDGLGPTIALRADMDALPAEENTGLPFASEIPGRMHACGHDAHMSMLLGAAALLKAEPPPGNVRLVFQPAEEDGGGARVVLRSGALEEVAAIFGAHVTHHHPTGEIMVKRGTVTAQSDNFTVRVRGAGGHGARPHETTDAVVIVGMLITALQTLVSRRANPVHPTVVTIGRVEAGTAHNVIAEHAVMEGTIRTTDREVRDHVITGLRRMVDAMSALHDAEVKLEVAEGYPPLVNHPRETEIARRAANRVVGAARVSEDAHPSMGSEDFAYYLERTPGAYVRIGARGPMQSMVPLHSPEFTIDEAALGIGARWFACVAREALAELQGEVR